MDIKINNFQYHQVFWGRKQIGYTQLQMLQKMPELLSKNISLEQISQETGRTRSSILQWVKDNTGFTFGYFQRKALMESYRDALTQYLNEQKSINEISELIGKSTDWTRNCLKELGLYRSRADVDKALDAQVPQLIELGYTIKGIANALNTSVSKVKQWIDANYKTSIVKIRHDNKTLIKHSTDKTNNRWKDELAEYLAAGMSLTEISRITGRPLSRLIYWLRIFGFTTKKQKMHELMVKKVPEMIEKKMKLDEMAKKIGLSDATISRWIRKTYGKTYLDIRLGR